MSAIRSYRRKIFGALRKTGGRFVNGERFIAVKTIKDRRGNKYAIMADGSRLGPKALKRIEGIGRAN